MPQDLIKFLNEKLNLSDDLTANEKLDIVDRDLENLVCDEPMTSLEVVQSSSSGYYE